MKGIILAGGSGKRLYPVTLSVCKQLLPIYDKPMIYYPLSVLMLAGIHEILIISTPDDLPKFRKLFGDGSQFGLDFTYAEQTLPKGIAEAFVIGNDFIGEDNVCLILGDNVFYGDGLTDILKNAVNYIDEHGGATIFGYYVNDPERYGVVDFNNNGEVLTLEEKPKYPKSNHAITGLYFYDNNVVNISKYIKPSSRGELEITDINKYYLKKKKLSVKVLHRGFAWLDTGTFHSMLQASEFIATIENRQGLKIACIEEIAYRMEYINDNQLVKLAEHTTNESYRKYLLNLLI
jgi:glucose-1-phosphate thymidylyltransferase